MSTNPKLYIEIIGQGPPIILLHGWGWNSQIWEPLVPKLQQKYQLFLVDFPGFGKSPLLTDNYSFDNIIPLLLHSTPPEATWLGWSMGGLFALWVAIYYPSRVTNLITISSSPRFTSAPNWPGIPLSTLEKFSQLLISEHEKTLLDFLELQLRGSPNQTELITELKTIALNPKPSQPALIGGLELLRTTDLRENARKLHCPSLHIFGQYDTIVPANLVKIFPEIIPHGQLEVIPRTGHMAFLTHPEKFLCLLNQFIKP